MSRHLLLGTFAEEHKLIAATTAAHERGYPIVDVYTPYPVHGLDKAMGLKPSRLGVFCFMMGVAGVGLAMLLQHWTMAIDWPINVGGRPFNSWPAYVPVAFEVLVLLAGFGVVFAFFGVSRLFPGKTANIASPDVTNDRFILVVEAKEAAVDGDAVLRLYREHGAVEAVERDEDLPNSSASWCNAKLVNGILGGLLIVTIGLNWGLGTNHATPNREFLPEMVHAVPYESFGTHPDLPNQMVLQAPIEGTIARGQKPMHYQATPKDAERAGEKLVNPFSLKDGRRATRGAQVFANYCQMCHGPAGKGDGPVSQRGVPPPPSLLAEKALKMKDGQMFHIVTYGQGDGPGRMAAYAGQVPPDDRWAVILHLRKLQKAGGIAP
jgi:mono/diheme cytochrome c family protein